MNGHSQAVRIPHELRLDATQVDISRTTGGNLLIRPLPAQRGMALLQVLQAFDGDFVAALEQDRSAQALPQGREAL
ncbi:MAG: AbrB family transcriptional regulator [Aquabacterium sp.]|nr:AbrB family transcriptional regulator [Aquabacterium sp.]